MTTHLALFVDNAKLDAGKATVEIFKHVVDCGAGGVDSGPWVCVRTKW